MKIDEHGSLFIKRAGKWKKQYCPFGTPNSCADHCPHFGEPEVIIDQGGAKHVSISICDHVSLVCPFDDFIDERPV